MLLELLNINKSFGAEIVLENINITVNEGDRIGLLGRNGAGKTTLLNIITGELSYDSGALNVQKGAEIGYLRQSGALDLKNTINEEIHSVFENVYEVGRRLDEVRKDMSEISHDSENYHVLMREYDRLNTLFEGMEGYFVDVKINTVLGGMGFLGYDRNMPVCDLSGGEKTRLALCKLLLKNPQLLILDEPTNHLDFATLSWLEGYLSTYKGAILVVSHDRYFLDKIVSDICEIEYHHLIRYKGGYSKFIKQKEERIISQQKEYERQQEEIAKMRDYVARNLAKSSSSNSVGSRVIALEKMELLAKPKPVRKNISLRFFCDTEPHKTVFHGENITVCVGEGENRKQLCSNIDINIERGEKVAVIGQNGVGKSSLLKAIQKIIPCDGRFYWGGNTKVSFFEQENSQLNLENSVLEEVHRRFPFKREIEIRTALASLLITGEDVFKKIGDLSGGERAKVAFCIIMLERANVLILDEPTNHLDYQAKEVLDKALSEYEGTLIMVSHDRYFLNRVPSRIIEMFPEAMYSYKGGYDYYITHKKQQPAVPASKKQKSASKNQYHRTRQQRYEEQKQKNRISSMEKEISSLEEEIDRLQNEIASPDIASDYEKLSERCGRIKQLNERLEEAMEEWIIAVEQ